MLLSAGFLGASAWELEGIRDGITMPGTNVFWTDDPNSYQHTGIILDADTRDLGNVGTTTFLRSGLLLHRQPENDQYIHHIPGVYGHHRIDAILKQNVNMLRYSATGAPAAAEKKVLGVIQGRIKIDRIMPPQAVGYAGSVTVPGLVGDNSEFSVKRMLGHRFTWQDRVAVAGPPWLDIVNVTASITLVADDNGFAFSNVGDADAIVFTLPAPKRGLHYYFLSAANQSFQFASAEGDNLVTLNDAAADSVTLSTASEMIGGGFLVASDGTRWFVLPMLWEAQTVTVATA